MNNLCVDIGYKSINHHGEQLCGDHVEIVEQNENSTVIVLADGLGSGVKASILSTLTSKIISTMMAAGLPIDECDAGDFHTFLGSFPPMVLPSSNDQLVIKCTRVHHIKSFIFFLLAARFCVFYLRF